MMIGVMMKNTDFNIDWTEFYCFKPDEIECKCGQVYYSHSKGCGIDNTQFVIVTETPCPKCGASANNVRRVTGPPEQWGIE